MYDELVPDNAKFGVQTHTHIRVHSHTHTCAHMHANQFDIISDHLAINACTDVIPNIFNYKSVSTQKHKHTHTHALTHSYIDRNHNHL